MATASAFVPFSAQFPQAVAPVTGQSLTASQLVLGGPEKDYTTAGTLAIDTLYGWLLEFPTTITISAIKLTEVTAAGTACNIRLGLYTFDGTYNPANLIVAFSAYAVTTGGTGTNKTVQSSLTQVIPAGPVWLAAVLNGTIATFAGPSTSTGINLPILAGQEASYSSRLGYSRAFSYAALPATWGTPTGHASAMIDVNFLI